MRTRVWDGFRCAGGLGTALVLGLTVAVGGGPVEVAAAAEGAPHSRNGNPTLERAAATFGTFCQEWMQRLAKRNEDNLARIKWETDEAGVRGAYVGYSPEHVCAMNENSVTAPTGKITYHEFRYEKRGATVSEARVSAPRPIEIFEVIEIFTFKNGHWAF